MPIICRFNKPMFVLLIYYYLLALAAINHFSINLLIVITLRLTCGENQYSKLNPRPRHNFIRKIRNLFFAGHFIELNCKKKKLETEIVARWIPINNVYQHTNGNIAMENQRNGQNPTSFNYFVVFFFCAY